MTNNQVAIHYKNFVDSLYQLINANADVAQIAQFVLTDRYCKFLCNKVAHKYNVDSAEIHAQLVLDTMENKIFINIPDAQSRFSGRYFQWRIINIAKRLQFCDSDELTEELIYEQNISEEAIQRNITASQHIELEKLKCDKISELNHYAIKLAAGMGINLDAFSNVIELSIQDIADKINIPRYKLTRHPNHYRALLQDLFSKYIALAEKWFALRYGYLDSLIERHGSLLKIYNMAQLGYSYSKFAEQANNMTIWQLEEIHAKIGEL